jgi:S-adenosylmethionine synthetase
VLNFIKRLLGINQPTPIAAVHDQITDAVTATLPEATPKEKVAKATVKTETLTVTATASVEEKVKPETKKSLEKLTKSKIDDLAQERFGVSLDRRKSKDIMIDEFLAAQKKDNR